MADRDEVRSILEDTLENPYWAEYYHDALSDRCREFIALEFYYSEYEDEEVGAEMDRIEAEMDAADLRHLLKHCGNNPRKKCSMTGSTHLPRKESDGVVDGAKAA